MVDALRPSAAQGAERELPSNCHDVEKSAQTLLIEPTRTARSTLLKTMKRPQRVRLEHKGGGF